MTCVICGLEAEAELVLLYGPGGRPRYFRPMHGRCVGEAGAVDAALQKLGASREDLAAIVARDDLLDLECAQVVEELTRRLAELN